MILKQSTSEDLTINNFSHFERLENFVQSNVSSQQVLVYKRHLFKSYWQYVDAWRTVAVQTAQTFSLRKCPKQPWPVSQTAQYYSQAEKGWLSQAGLVPNLVSVSLAGEAITSIWRRWHGNYLFVNRHQDTLRYLSKILLLWLFDQTGVRN